jgi:glycosyltransferase involved in cell wall biosynthesis
MTEAFFGALSPRASRPQPLPTRVCLITTGQPSTNPRLVKEADALVEAGYQVHVIATHWSDWATEMDRRLLASRTWRMTFIDWRKEHAPAFFLWSRVRHWAARRLTAFPPLAERLTTAALGRAGPELREAACAMAADLYIAHNLGALPVACSAADLHNGKVGFDAEDFHSGQLSRPEDARAAEYTRAVERRLIPRCHYVTAASPGIAEAYRDLCEIPLPTCILNVFPLRDRPPRPRPAVAGDPVRLYWFSQTIGPDRGLEDAVRAMGLLNTHRLELHVRGRWQPGYETHLRQLAGESGVHQDRLLSHDPAMPDDMARLASRYDIGLALEPPVSTNNDILLSNKIFTYLLAGDAVLVTRTRGQSRLMPEIQAAAASCEPGNPDSLASALRPWLEDRGALDAAREAARRLGETRFNWDREKVIFLDVVGRTLRPGGYAQAPAIPSAGRTAQRTTADHDASPVWVEPTCR